MRKSAKILVLFLIIFCTFVQCVNKGSTANSSKLFKELNAAIGAYNDRNDLIKARGTLIEAISRNMQNNDTIILVETIDNNLGMYICISYTLHNKMTTFYNARKALDPQGVPIGDFVQSSGETPPNEALSFIDAFQNEHLEQYIQQRNESTMNTSGHSWIITRIKTNGDQYSVTSRICK